MEAQYYRKTIKKPPIPAWLRKLAKSNWARIIVLAGIPILSFVTFNPKGILQHIHLQKVKNEMIEKIALAQKEQLQLQQVSKAIDKDPKMIEKVARENYGMVREGETVYKVKKDK
ncbi:MAG: septum formation initiator family protein [Bacteroidota bacterium]